MIENVEKRWAIHHKILSEDTKYKVITMYAAIILFTGFFFNTPLEILKGMGTVLTSSSILLTDYMEIANIGTAFFNSGLMMLGSIFLARKTRAHMNGYLIAAVSIVGGFAMFGKNPYNVVSIVLGVYLYSRIQKERPDVATTRSFSRSWTLRSLIGVMGRSSWSDCQSSPPSNET